MKEKLPCVFRINVANNFWQGYREKLTSENFLKDLLGEDFGIKITPKNLTNKLNHQNLVFDINLPKGELKKNENLSKFHKFIQNSVAAGLISRQEAVSMIPPLLMDVQPSDNVLDTCAAPGSKTAQFLEAFYKDYDYLNPETIKNDTGMILINLGFVIANDNNYNRANMMTHQLKRLNTAGMMVVSHDAQQLPNIWKDDDEKLQFTKILCDVPCSSDAVLRKLPGRWAKWGPKEAFHLHRLQMQIVKKAISALKVGGTIIYSTCSLNPIEVNKSLI
jgi:16S rRNA C967 or C1407 C5-methylase (RsmB/RsmF family)